MVPTVLYLGVLPGGIADQMKRNPVNRNQTIWDDFLHLHRLKLLIPILSFIFSGFVLLFGFIYEQTYFTLFGISVLDYTTYTHFLGAPFREPGTVAWAALTVFVAAVSLRIALGSRSNKESLLYQLQGLLVPLIMLYGVYLMVSNRAETAASMLPGVNVELRLPLDEEITVEEYLMIGRIGDSLFFCDTEEGNTIVLSESQVLRTTIVPGEPRDAEDCWMSFGGWN